MPRSFGARLLLLFCLATSFGCEERRPELPPGEPLLQRPATLTSFEMPQEALPLWRTEAEAKPALLLLSADALLQPLPATVREEALDLARKGNIEDLREHGPLRAEALLLPGQALSAALGAGYFSEVIWVLPQRNPEERIDLEATREHLFAIGAIDDYESGSLEATSTGFRGEIRGTPFRALLASHLPALEVERPAIVHIDLTFFTAIYQNEIRTPLFKLITGSLTDLRASGVRSIGTTLSLDTLIGQTPIDLRFIGGILEEIFSSPGLLEGSMPPRWELRARALYLDTFFQPEKMLELYRKMLAAEPRAPSVHFALYRTLNLAKQPDEAMAALARAAEGDPAYGREYMVLAAEAYRKGDVATAIELYRRAGTIFPGDPLVRVNLAKALADASRMDEASPLVEELLRLNWSKPYYPEMEAFLKSLRSRD